MESKKDAELDIQKLAAMSGLDIEPSKQPDNSAQAETINLDREHAKLDNYLAISKRFRQVLIWLPIGWLAIVIVVLITQMFVPPAYRLTSNILITLLSTTTINIVGLLYIVAKYLFSDHHHI